MDYCLDDAEDEDELDTNYILPGYLYYFLFVVHIIDTFVIHTDSKTIFFPARTSRQ